MARPKKTEVVGATPPLEKKSKKRGRKPKDKYNFDTSTVNFT